MTASTFPSISRGSETALGIFEASHSFFVISGNCVQAWVTFRSPIPNSEASRWRR